MEKEIWNESQKPGLAASTKLYFQDMFVGAKRMSRADFWWGYLGSTLIAAVIMLFFAWVVTALPISDYYWSSVSGLAIAITFGFYLVALFNAMIRRLHDTNKSAWWMLFLLISGIGYIVLVVMACLRQVSDGNQYDMVLESETD